MNDQKQITISVVSHKQINLINTLLLDLKNCMKNISKIIVTINVPEKIKHQTIYKSLPIKWVYNKNKLGFGENHNNAFLECDTEFFCVLNPDIHISKNIFDKLIYDKVKENVHIISPSIFNKSNEKEINCRQFPKLSFNYLIDRFNKRPHIVFIKEKLKYVNLTDWIGGMFLLITSDDFKKLKGFDTNYFLYFEDVDICYRAAKLNFKVGESHNVKAVHDARRQTHKKLTHQLYFLQSFLIYLFKRIRF